MKTLILAGLAPFIIGGQDEIPGSPISQQTVYIKGKIQRASFTCTGTILSENMILTAGHCLGGGGYADLVVHFGVQGEKAAIKVINQIRKQDNPVPSEYDWDDVAVLKLESKIPAGFRPVKFLSDVSLMKNGAAVILAGYGQTVTHPPSSGNGNSGRLRSVEQVVLQYPYGQTEILVSLQGKGACRGDSGGPAFVNINGELQQIGIASRMTENDRIPGGGRNPQYACIVDLVYTDILAQKNWIDWAIQKLN
jgi:secreted trypsin-like serine protease